MKRISNDSMANNLSHCKNRIQALRKAFEVRPHRIEGVHFHFRCIYRPLLMKHDGIARAAITFIMTQDKHSDYPQGRNLNHLKKAMPAFVNILKESVNVNETIEFRNRAFWVKGYGYEICIILEAFGKHSAWTGFCESDGEIKIDFLRRLNMYATHKRAQFLDTGYISKTWRAEHTVLAKYLCNPDLMSIFPNPADLFVYAVKRELVIAKRNLTNHRLRIQNQHSNDLNFFEPEKRRSWYFDDNPKSSFLDKFMFWKH